MKYFQNSGRSNHGKTQLGILWSIWECIIDAYIKEACFGGAELFALVQVHVWGPSMINNNNNVIIVSCHRPFLHGVSVEPTVIPITQTSSFRLEYCPYYVWYSSITVFYNEATDCFPGIAYKCFFKMFFTIPVVQVTAGAIIHFVFQIHCISIFSLFIIIIWFYVCDLLFQIWIII